MLHIVTINHCWYIDPHFVVLEVPTLEARQVVDADSNAWSAKQTFDSREKSGARHAGGP